MQKKLNTQEDKQFSILLKSRLILNQSKFLYFYWSINQGSPGNLKLSWSKTSRCFSVKYQVILGSLFLLKVKWSTNQSLSTQTPEEQVGSRPSDQRSLWVLPLLPAVDVGLHHLLDLHHLLHRRCWKGEVTGHLTCFGQHPHCCKQFLH